MMTPSTDAQTGPIAPGAQIVSGGVQLWGSPYLYTRDQYRRVVSDWETVTPAHGRRGRTFFLVPMHAWSDHRTPRYVIADRVRRGGRTLYRVRFFWITPIAEGVPHA